MYTSYYGLVDTLKEYKIKMVCISFTKPSWLPWIDEIGILAPPPNLIYESSILKMRKEYIAHLENVGVDEIKYQLAMRGRKNFALLCYEKYSDIVSGNKFCHRRLFASWYNQKTGIEIPEFDVEKIKSIRRAENLAFDF
jgi:hypothetical protein